MRQGGWDARAELEVLRALEPDRAAEEGHGLGPLGVRLGPEEQRRREGVLAPCGGVGEVNADLGRIGVQRLYVIFINNNYILAT